MHVDTIECIKGKYTMKQTYDTSVSNLIQVKKKRQRLTKTNILTSHQVTDASSANPSLTLQKAPPFSNSDPKDASSITSLTHQKAPIISNAISIPAEPPPSHPWTNFWPPNILKIINSIIIVPCATPTHPLFKFNLNLEAAHKNYFVMRKFNNNFEQALKAQQDSPLGYGSKFRKPSTLEPLLSCHPNWKHFKKLLKNGSEWPLDRLDESTRLQDINKALTFGNHKGASSKPAILQELINNNIIHSFALPLPLSKIRNIKGILFAPLNIQLQNTIDETVQIIPKDQMTHNQSFKWLTSGTSVNS